jgi:hypothetical protein
MAIAAGVGVGVGVVLLVTLALAFWFWRRRNRRVTVDEIRGGGWRDTEGMRHPVLAEMNGERERKPEELAGSLPNASAGAKGGAERAEMSC